MTLYFQQVQAFCIWDSIPILQSGFIFSSPSYEQTQDQYGYPQLTLRLLASKHSLERG